ncbi:MAG: Stp1/IreP family PP2C-type Ser/Thr phosphatase [Nitrospira defluvii]|nr:Stp1/IreP family PP2C-type Ser/Thr phosphatase [Nitrospira defluvii]
MWEWTAYGQTDRGLVRRTNQDTFLVDNRHRLWAVADGMGGHPGGDVASRLVVDTLANFAPTMTQNASESSATEEERATFCLTTMVEHAHAAILTHADHHPPLQGMGTTLVAAHLLLLPTRRLLVINVGDSRAYLIRERTITQLTRDHTLIEEHVRDGHLTPEQAARHPDRHVLTRAMGLGPTIESDIFPCDLMNGDLVLLCSDGLTKMLTDERILQTVLPHRHNPPLCTQALIAAALEEGGIDNVTVVACTMTESLDPANRH